MVPQTEAEVKRCADCGRAHATHWEHFICWIDCHPRYAWFWILVLGLNTLLDLLQIFGFGGR